MDRQKKLDHGGESLQNNLDEVLSMSITLQSQPAVFQPQPGTFPDYKPSALTDEVRTANLGDKRLNKRLAAVLEKLGANPKLSGTRRCHTRRCHAPQEGKPGRKGGFELLRTCVNQKSYLSFHAFLCKEHGTRTFFGTGCSRSNGLLEQMP